LVLLLFFLTVGRFGGLPFVLPYVPFPWGISSILYYEEIYIKNKEGP